MGFLDKAKAMADDLAQKADAAMASQGIGTPGAGADRYLRDLGVIAYLDAAGRPVPAEDRERVMAALRDLEQRGQLGSLTLKTTAEQQVTPPPPPGATAQTAQAGPTAQAPPPPAPSPAQPAEPASPATPPPPPPPPSWAKPGDA